MPVADVWGFDWDGVPSQSMEGPGAGRYLFQLTAAKKDINKKKKPYVNAGCKVIAVIKGPEGAKGLVHWEYLSLEPERKGYTKNFFEKIGAGHCLRADRSPKDAEGTMFEADVIISQTERGEFHNLRRIVAVDAKTATAQAVGTEDVAAEAPGNVEGEEAGEDGDLTVAEIAAMSASQLKALAGANEVEIPEDVKGVKKIRAFMAEELLGEEIPTGGSNPRRAQVGAAR